MTASNPPSSSTTSADRRVFLQATALVGSTLFAAPAVHAGGSDELKVGLIGCGGRGSGAAVNAVRAGPGIKLWAMGDMFSDRLESHRQSLMKEIGDRMDVPNSRCFVGFDAYKQVIAADVDVVVLATPPGFRPLHLEAAVEAGKHVFCEKPVAVDGPGVRRVMETAKKAKQKGLSLVSGFCWRYDLGMQETMKRLADGAIGSITAMQCSYNTGMLWMNKRQPQWSDMEWQLRNWLYFTWLSGDHNVEQHIHSLDKMAWAMGDQYPVKAVGLGGRQARTSPDYGHIFDHHAVVYEFANGVRCFSYCRQQAACANDITDHYFGTKGTAMTHGANGTAWIKGESPWQYNLAMARKAIDKYQFEHNVLFKSIREKSAHNDGEWMAKSTLMGIMGRMATYTGQAITWEMAMNSKEDLTPAKMEMGSMPVAPVAIPGQTKFM